MRLGFSRSVYNPRCRRTAIRYTSTQRLRRPVSHLAAVLRELKDNQDRSASTSTKTPTRKRAYDASSPEAKFGRHVLRTILRECSYLPDSFAADYIRKHAVSRIRANEYKTWKNSEQFDSQNTTRRKEARSVISILQRANAGHRSPMLKILNTAYGRTGKRRHELIKPLLPVPEQNEYQELDAGMAKGIIKGTARKETFRKLSPTTPLDLTPQLRALLKSQIRARPPSTRTTLRSIEPSIPELNSWLRPMPQNRIRNARKKQYAMLLNRVQPPLPDEEWERLRDLALGKLPVDGPAKRRQRPTPAAEAKAFSNSESSALELVARYGRLPTKASPRNGERTVQTHRNEQRWMQRLYVEVFGQCPSMKWNHAMERWKVTWGFQELALPESSKSSMSKDQALDAPASELSAIEAAG